MSKEFFIETMRRRLALVDPAEEIRQMFKAFDRGCRGFITRDDLRQVWRWLVGCGNAGLGSPLSPITVPPAERIVAFNYLRLGGWRGACDDHVMSNCLFLVLQTYAQGCENGLTHFQVCVT